MDAHPYDPDGGGSAPRPQIRVVHGEAVRLVVDDDHPTGVELADGQVVRRAALFVRPINTPPLTWANGGGGG